MKTKLKTHRAREANAIQKLRTYKASNLEIQVIKVGKATELTLGRGNLGHERQGHFFQYPH